MTAPSPAGQAHPSREQWRVEIHDSGAWMPLGLATADRDKAVERLAARRALTPAWADGTPVQYRLVRETTTYTVEEA